MALAWKDYVKIRKLDLVSYFKSRDIRSYEQLLSRINTGDCVPPLESEVEHLFVREEKAQITLEPTPSKVLEKIEVEEIPEEKPSVKPKRKYTRRKKTSTAQKTDISKRKPRKKRTTKTAPKTQTDNPE